MSFSNKGKRLDSGRRAIPVRQGKIAGMSPEFFRVNTTSSSEKSADIHKKAKNGYLINKDTIKHIFLIVIIGTILMSSTIIVSATTPPVTPSLANSAQQASNNSTVKLAATSLVSPAQPATNAKSTNTYGVTMKYRWVYFRDNIETAANLQKAEDVMARAVKVGYNGFVLSNTQMERLNTATTTYLNNLATLKSYADSLGMQLYPTVLTVGFANAMLSHESKPYRRLTGEERIIHCS